MTCISHVYQLLYCDSYEPLLAPCMFANYPHYCIAVMAANKEYRTNDATLLLPVTHLGTDYMTATVSSDGAPSQLAVVAYYDSLVQVHLPRTGKLPQIERTTLGMYQLKCALSCASSFRTALCLFISVRSIISKTYFLILNSNM